MKIDIRALFYAGAFVVIYEVSTHHRLRWLHLFSSLNKSDQSLLELKISETLFSIFHSKANHP